MAPFTGFFSWRKSNDGCRGNQGQPEIYGHGSPPEIYGYAKAAAPPKSPALTILRDHLETLAGTPKAPAKLHELILQLAIRGHIVPQNNKDTPASEAADRARSLAQAGLPAITEESAPFALPEGWSWLRIGEAMRLINGRAFKPSEWSTSGLPIVRIQNLNNPDAPFNYCDFEVEEKVLIRNEDFLISWSGTPGTSFGAFIWNRGSAVLNQHIFRAELIGSAYDKRFLRLAINGRLDEMIAKAHGGVGLQHITKGKLELLVLPVPPLLPNNAASWPRSRNC